MKSDLKDITHYEREKYQSFDSLRVALRKIEKENIQESEGKISKQISKKAIVEDKPADDEMKGMLKSITHRLENLETAQRGRSRFRPTSRGSRYRNQTYRGRNLRNDFTRESKTARKINILLIQTLIADVVAEKDTLKEDVVPTLMSMERI